MAEPATRIDAAPPKPLNSPTSSGIEVILTLTAVIAPITEPIATPTRMYDHSKRFDSRVAAIASAMPRAPAALPRTAVRGWAIHFRSRMNRTAAAR